MPSHLPKPRKFATVKKIKEIWKQHPDKKSAGIDTVTPVIFKQSLESNILAIHKELISGTYKFQKLIFNKITKSANKDRIICIPSVRDRLVQRLILDHLIYPKDRLSVCNEISYGCTRKRGTHAAIKKIVAERSTYGWVVKTDISTFFDSIDRPYLYSLIEKKLKNSSLLPLLRQVINCEIQVKNAYERNILVSNGIIQGKGLRQGMPLSPLLSNMILSKFDRALKKHNFNAIRYIDDIIVICKSQKDCSDALETIESELSKIKLSIPSLSDSSQKTAIKNPNEAVEFLGIEIFKADNEYCTMIPNHSIDRILSDLNQYSNFDFIKSMKLTYAQLSKLLDEKQNGYMSAYNGTTNINSFISRYSSKKAQIKLGLLTSILGADVINSLKNYEKEFLGIT